MSADEKHPLYEDWLPDWELMRDTHKGPRAIKDAGHKYLYPTAGMRADGWPNANTRGWHDYEAYKQRAVFPDLMKTAVKKMVGVMHRKPATIKVPDRMLPMLDAITPIGDSAQGLLAKINEAQLIVGRCGLLLEAPTGKAVNEAMPYVAFYSAFSIINWDEGQPDFGKQPLQFVSLEETGFERQNDYSWQEVEKWRVLSLPQNEDGTFAPYQVAVLRQTKQINPDAFMVPSIGGRTMDAIPFTFVNTIDLNPCPEDPPLLPLANLSLVIYRGEADYRQTLFMQSQETLVIIGQNTALNPGQSEEVRAGAGATIELPMNGDAKFVGPQGAGLAEQRTALENDHSRASELAGGLVDFGSVESAGGGNDQSGKALKVRVAASAATLTQIARVGAKALETTLKHAAVWLGLNPDDVSVEPNLEFAENTMTGEELTALMTAKNMGAPLSIETIHDQMVARDMTRKTLEEELELIEQEKPIGITNELALKQIEADEAAAKNGGKPPGEEDEDPDPEA